MTMKRILAVDYGAKRIGLAVSDPLNIVATPLDTLSVSRDVPVFTTLKNVIDKYGVDTVLVGYPMGLSGKKTDQTRLVDHFISELKTVTSARIIPWDERFTSSEAEDILREKGVKPSRNKGLIDQMSARIILQEYLNSGKGL
jgi:putative holliday junction resolvase